MRRFAQFGKLKPESRERYIALHAEVWPKVLEVLKTGNIGNYSIYIQGNNVFQYFEYYGSNFIEDSDKMKQNPVNIRWQAETSQCFETFYSDAEEVFHLE